jgi:Uma2 family endonuclease
MVTAITPKILNVDVPQRRKMSYEEYLKFAPDSLIVEWVDGEVIIYMPPIYVHQNLVSFLHRLLGPFIQAFGLGISILAPFEVKLWPGGPAREPDIIFIGADNLDILTAKKIEGAPDLLIEIISPGSVTEDRIRKFSQYEQAGVREYWVIDPRPHQQQADFYLLGEDGLYQAVPLDEDGTYHSTVLPGFWLKVNWLWAEELPDPDTTFTKIILSTETLPDEVSAAYKTIQKWLESKE